MLNYAVCNTFRYIATHPYNHTHSRIQNKVLFVGPDPKEMFQHNQFKHNNYIYFLTLELNHFKKNLNHENTVFYDLNNIPKNKQKQKNIFFYNFVQSDPAEQSDPDPAEQSDPDQDSDPVKLIVPKDSPFILFLCRCDTLFDDNLNETRSKIVE